MKLKSLVILSTSALLSAAILPAATAQDADSNARPVAIDVTSRRGADQADPRHPRPRRDIDRLYEHLDANGDGFIDSDEFLDARLTRLDRKFDRRDLDGDGLISEEEAERRRHAAQHPDVDREEVIQCVRRFIADFEAKHDEAVEDRFDKVDLNGDGFLDFAELSIALEERAYELFDRIDTDLDGQLSLEEIEAFAHYQVNLRRVIRHCIDLLSDPFEVTI